MLNEKGSRLSSQLLELQNNAKLSHWYSEIQSQKQSGLTVDEWCEQSGLNRSKYYYRYKIVMRALESRLAAEDEESVRFAALPPAQPKPLSGDAIHIRLGALEVEIPSGAKRENIQAVIEALKC